MFGSWARHERVWEQTFQEHGLGSTQAQRARLAGLMISNDFTSVFSLLHATHPRKWQGADAFPENELEELQQFCRYGQRVQA